MNSKRLKWLQRHKKLAPFYTTALAMLKNGPRAQEPSWAAIKKMMVVVAQSPRINVPDIGRIPAITMQGRHERGSWRSYPRVVIDANMEVPQ